jgi:HEPN domain-containing protein
MSGKRKEEAARWFQQARYDLKAAQWNMEGEFFNTSCFLAHQSAEKGLKSLLYYVGSRRKALLTHSLVEMVQEGGKKLNPLLDLMEHARRLDMHYIPSRYPNGLPGGTPHRFYSRNMAGDAIESAQRIYEAVAAYYRSQGETEILEED